MMPRPRSRKHAVAYVDPEVIAEEIARLVAEGPPPVAIVSGIREWRLFQGQPEARSHMQFWPGGDITFDGVPVIIHRDQRAPAVMADQQELESALLGGDQ